MVIVAPAFIVRPPNCVPFLIVDEAKEISPSLKYCKFDHEYVVVVEKQGVNVIWSGSVLPDKQNPLGMLESPVPPFLKYLGQQ